MTEHPLPLHPSYEPIGRMLPNAFGVEELVVMHQNYWDYYDWLVDQGYDMEDWVIRADTIREPGISLSDHLMWCLWHMRSKGRSRR
ncbi:hypothetical protein AADZ90_021910 [Aestuariibius sp. 2305UL40-4]|uniref:hypothetical protein n=1 Tax=Aestuariibius violaceus TaxID=3234132 RepID=UPI00398F3769